MAVAEPVGFIDCEIKRLSQEMINVMRESDGIGLAAPQVGVSKRLIVVGAGEEEPSAMVNPVITWRSTVQDVAPEGCLSLPGILIDVSRSRSITVRYLDLEGREHTRTYTGLLARVVQHEVDHLDGIMMLKYLEKGPQVPVVGFTGG